MKYILPADEKKRTIRFRKTRLAALKIEREAARLARHNRRFNPHALADRAADRVERAKARLAAWEVSKKEAGGWTEGLYCKCRRNDRRLVERQRFGPRSRSL